VLDKVTGTSVPVDLGEHVVTFAPPGRPSVEQRHVFREGEKSRHIRVMVDAPTQDAAAPATASSPAAPVAGGSPAPTSTDPRAEAPSATPGRGQRIAGYAVGGAGLVGLAVGGLFGYLTISAKSDQVDNCGSPTTCPNYAAARSAHEDGKTDGLISTVAFIAGGAATGAGVVLLLTAGSGTSESGARPLRLAASATPGAAGVSLRGSF
jgi:hypothetical protein